MDKREYDTDLWMLDEMFDMQRRMQERLGSDVNSQAYRTEMCLALVDETLEALRETPWKSWKKSATYNEDKFREELIDAWHFLINLSIASGMDAQSVYDMFCNKNSENHDRQRRGY